MQKTAKAITLFEVTEFQPEMREMGDIISLSAKRTVEAVGMLKTMRDNAKALHEFAEAITQLEETADDLHDKGLKALYLRSRPNDALGFIVGRDIYSHLEKVMDRFEDVANRVSGILVEHL